MYRIQSNPTGTRSIEVSEQHLATIEKYLLFRDLIDSNGYIDEQVLDKLKLNIRALLESEATTDKAVGIPVSAVELEPQNAEVAPEYWFDSSEVTAGA